MHVVYGGNTRSAETLNVFCVCFGGDIMIIGRNEISNEKQLLELVFKRLREINPIVIMGYQARRDIFLMLERGRLLSADLKISFNIYRNRNFSSYPLRPHGSDDAYSFAKMYGLDIKEMAFRYFDHDMDHIFPVPFVWISSQLAMQCKERYCKLVYIRYTTIDAIRSEKQMFRNVDIPMSRIPLALYTANHHGCSST